MSHTLTLKDSRIPSGELPKSEEGPLKNKDWWADFGLGERANLRPNNPFERKVDVTSGLLHMQELAEELKRRGREQRVEAVAPAAVPVVPPTVFPVEATLDAPRRTVWVWPAMGAALVLVALASVLGTLWYTGNVNRPSTTPAAGPPKAPKVAAAVLPVTPDQDRSDTPTVTAPARPASNNAPAVTPPVTDTPVAAPDTTDEVDRPRDRRRRKKRRSRRDKKEDADEVTAAPAGYSLQAALGRLQKKTAAKRPVVAPSKAAGIAPESAMAPERGSTASTLRMLKAAAARPARPQPTASTLPPRLSSAEVARAARRVRRGVQQCLKRFGFGHTTLRLRLTVAGKTGRVTAARAKGRFAGTPAGRCAARRAQGLRFPRFDRPTQTVVLPIRTH